MTEPETGPPKVLFICTGNYYRSRFAEILFNSIAREAGAAAKVCGAGGGGVVLVWAVPGATGDGPRERVTKALRESGLAPMDYRLDLRGLEVEAAS